MVGGDIQSLDRANGGNDGTNLRLTPINKLTFHEKRWIPATRLIQHNSVQRGGLRWSAPQSHKGSGDEEKKINKYK